MHPVGSFVLGVVAALVYAMGEETSRIALPVLFCIGVLSASLPVPRVKGHPAGAWVASPFDMRGPMIVYSDGLRRVLEKVELKAIMAHEMHHMILEDRAWRFAAGAIGGCTPALVAGMLLKATGPVSLSKVAVVVAISVIVALVQSRMYQRSERRADTMAAQLVGSAEVVRTAHEKIARANSELWGLGVEELEKSEDELHAQYVTELGGMHAVPKRRIGIDEVAGKSNHQTVPIGDREFAILQLSAVGEFIILLVDGRRTIEEICQEARKQRGFRTFEVCRILRQLKSADVIAM